MIEILNTLVSLDLFKEFFCCDLDKCHGLCCVEGDAGAPVTPDEVEMLEEAYEKLHEDLPLQAQQQIEKEGVVYPDKEGELVTQIINGKDCVFAKHEGACALCDISLAGYRHRTECACDRSHGQQYGYYLFLHLFTICLSFHSHANMAIVISHQCAHSHLRHALSRREPPQERTVPAHVWLSPSVLSSRRR